LLLTLSFALLTIYVVRHDLYNRFLRTVFLASMGTEEQKRRAGWEDDGAANAAAELGSCPP
jgi:hypothetical protein